jgi:crotonobetainyl-CoA:carnitine CoA-transferase CaiB-like acyl-CoA transferase
VPFGPVLRVDEIFGDGHTAARGMLAEVELPGVPEHPLVIADTAIKMTGTPGGVRFRAPLVGEHTARVLAGIGYTPSEVDELMGPRGACRSQ